MNLQSYSAEDLILKRRALRRQLLEGHNLRDIRIAVLGGSTTNELVDFWELLLLAEGFKPVFYQTEYGRYYADAVVSPEEILAFSPDLVFVYTTIRNVADFPLFQTTTEQLNSIVEAEFTRFQQIWNSLDEKIGCQIIQNNFELPLWEPLGNLDAVHPAGHSHFVTALNQKFASEAFNRPKLLLQDIHGLSARMGLNQWFDRDRWFSYKLAQTVEASLLMAQSLTSIIRALYGRSRKVLVLDLDNTLWGGVIGDDGVERIMIGKETPVAEAYTAFQEYCLSQRDRGILLAVCSKNEEATAKLGFEHPDSVLKLEHFSAFKANWNPKNENIAEIAQELNLGIDSLVFVDDNPAEREIVSAQLPGVAVPDMGDEVSRFIDILERERYFEPVSLGAEDLQRARLYKENTQRASLQQKFATYGDYLQSLEMTAEIDVFRPMYIERIAQLTNKSNQFNLTGRRYTFAEMESVMREPEYIALYGRLADRFGDNGLIAVVLGRKQERQLHMDLWLMSCRVLKRQMEVAMLEALVDRARTQELEQIVGYYIPTKKNGMVSRHYESLGFTQTSAHPDGTTCWTLDLDSYSPSVHHIQVAGNRAVLAPESAP